MATCSKCGSTNIQAMKRGYSVTTGPLGMNQVITVCVDCGRQSVPGGTSMERASASVAQKDAEYGARVEARAARLTPEGATRYRVFANEHREKWVNLSLIAMFGGMLGGCGGCIAAANASHGTLGVTLLVIGIGGGCLLYVAYQSVGSGISCR